MGIETYSEETLNEDFLTVTQLAQLLQVPKSWVYGQTMKKGHGAIPRIKFGKYLRFLRSDIEKWIEEQRDTSI
ncbi:MAG: helix-turn-helix domain-containing protein [Candidatus Hodarchaeota archaeon]